MRALTASLKTSTGEQRLAALDGYRGLFVTLVLLYHFGATFLVGGWVGINHFFAFSGYLITRLLISERARTGGIDVLRFASDDFVAELEAVLADSADHRHRGLCEAEGVGISVMKPFHGGQLLSDETSPFRNALTRNQCLKYALDRPAVLTVLPGVRNLADLSELLKFGSAAPEECDYSVIGSFTPKSARGNCVYCNHCEPCPAGIDIGLINKYYDLSLAGDKMAHDHYSKLKIKADACISCGHCDSRCPFGVEQSVRMEKIAKYFDN